MARTSRNLILLLAVVLLLSGRAMASTTATITVNGAEQSGDANTITVAFNGFTETVHYGQYSTPASLASALAGMFSRDYLQAGLCAAVSSAGGSTINLKLRGGAAFGALDVTGSTASFTLSESGFASQESTTTPDTGTVTLTVSNSGGTVFTKSTNYGEGATPSSVAEGLTGADSNVNVAAVNDTLYIQATGTGSATDYYYTVTSSWNSIFSQPSFQGSPASGNLGGGASANTSPTPVYCFGPPGSTFNSNGCSPSNNSMYDAVGNVVGYSDLVMGTWSMTTANGSNGYDTLNRLIGAQASTGPYQGLQATWSYDSFGNRTSEVFSLAAGANVSKPVPPSTVVTPATNNQMQTIQMGTANYTPRYDPSGDLITDPSTGNQYAYDAEGRVCAVSGPSGTMGYMYDAEGTRVAKSTIQLVMVNGTPTLSCDITQNGFMTGNETDYVLGPDGEQVTELAQDADGAMNWQRTYVYAGSALFATYDPDPDNPAQPLPSFRLTDWLGTLRVTTDAYGVAQSLCTGLPFGDGADCGGDLPDPHYFTGKERDPESGNDYFGARYYANSMGRWLSPDWSAKIEPVPYAKLDNPQSLNLYAYVFNNPLTGIDPDGHGCDDNSNACWLFNNGYAWAVTELNATAAFNQAVAQQQSGQQGQQNQQQLKYKTISGGKGSKEWTIQWQLSKKSKNGGWIVQQISTYNKSGKWAYTYWEAWSVPKGSKFTSYYPESNDDTFRDYSGFRTDASARFYEGLNLPSSFEPNNPGTYAHMLPSTGVDPNLPTDNATAPVDRTWTAP